MNNVETQVAELDSSDDGVEVGAVPVHNAAGVADDPGYIQDIRVEEAKSAGQGYHQPCEFVAHGVSQGIKIGVSVGVRGQRDDVETSHRCGCRVGPVRRVGDQNVLALIVAAIEVVGPCHQKAREFTVSARHRGERAACHACYLVQDFLQLPHQLDRTLNGGYRLQWMYLGESRNRRNLVVQLRVVLHRATAERVEVVVY